MSLEPLAIVAGSGMELEALFDSIDSRVLFADIPQMPVVGVVGHGGHFLKGECCGRTVFLQCGRPHMYEGHTPAEAAQGVEIMIGWGAKTLIFLNAVGGLSPCLFGGELVAVDEVWAWPFLPHPLPSLQETDFLLEGCDMTGPCVWMHGPCYETHAEISLLQASGAATVGMSLAAEVARCHKLGVRCAAVSCVANLCGALEPVSHAHVLDTMQRATPRILSCLHSAIEEYGNSVCKRLD